MTRDELTELMATDANISKAAADKALKSFCDHTTAALLAGEAMKITGFGTFKASITNATNLRNPKTGETKPGGAVLRTSFKAGRTLRNNLQPLIHLHRKAA